MPRKPKISLTVDSTILKEARSKASIRNKSLSNMVEEYLKFFARCEVYCVNCSQEFSLLEAELCGTCGWFKCPKKNCGWCICKMDELKDRTMSMRRLRWVYERLLGTNYDQLYAKEYSPR